MCFISCCRIRSYATEEVDEADGPSDAAELPEFYPDEDGARHVLPDGVVTFVRLRMINGSYVHEWVLPDRRTTLSGSACNICRIRTVAAI